MFNVLITGKLTKPPKLGLGKNGQPYCTATLRVPVQGQREDEPDHLFASIIGFGLDAQKLGQLGQGDALSVSGNARISQWERDGRVQTGLNVTVTGLLSVYEVRKRRGDPAPHHAPLAQDVAGHRSCAPERPVLFDQAEAVDDDISF